MSLAFLISGGVFVYVAHQTGYMMLEEQIREKAHDIASVSDAVLMTAMAEEKHGRLSEFLAALNSSRQFTDVLVLRRDGTIYCRTDTSRQAEGFPLQQFNDTTRSSGEQYITTKEHGSAYEYIITPIEKYQSCYRCHTQSEPNRGFFAVKLSVDEVRGTALKHRETNILMIAGTFCGVAGVIIFTLLFVVVRPMTRIHRLIKNVESELNSIDEGKHVEFSQFEIPSSKDEITDVIVAFNRLTTRLNEVHRKLYELHQVELEHADRLASTGRMAASVAHEIRNPVAGVLGALQVFESEITDDDERKDILREMKLQLERVNFAVTELLSYARPTPPVSEDFLVNELIQKTVTLLSPQVRGKQIEFRMKLTNEKMLVSADKKQIQQVLWNVILNALQAMETSGTLSIASFRGNQNAMIRISDTGKGIPPDAIDRVFKPFFTTKSKGTGLGLAVSKRIIEQHGGLITIESQLNQGTTVTLALPLQGTISE